MAQVIDSGPRQVTKNVRDLMDTMAGGPGSPGEHGGTQEESRSSGNALQEGQEAADSGETFYWRQIPRHLDRSLGWKNSLYENASTGPTVKYKIAFSPENIT